MDCVAMARPLRIEFGGAVYHVMARGNQGRAICQNQGDRKMWLATLGAACERTGWRVHAWVLMDNHFHLLLETPEPNLVRGMKWLQGTYTQRYNARHRERGHLFQGRYRAVPGEVGEAMYFQTVSTYIHLNPARAKLIELGREKLGAYPWSSYPNYVRGTGRVGWNGAGSWPVWDSGSRKGPATRLTWRAGCWNWVQSSQEPRVVEMKRRLEQGA